METQPTHAPASSHRVMLRSDVLEWLRQNAEAEGETLSFVLNRALLTLMQEADDLGRLDP